VLYTVKIRLKSYRVHWGNVDIPNINNFCVCVGVLCTQVNMKFVMLL
jgi:hypothetical protein